VGIINVIAVSGYKKSGKSTLCRTLISALSARGFSVGYIKRTQESVASPPDTDSGAVGELGVPSLMWGGDGSLRFETPRDSSRETDAREIAGRHFPQADMVILEGGKDLNLPKIWVAHEGEQVPDVPGIFAVYDRHRRGSVGRVYGADYLDCLVADVEVMIGEPGAAARVYIDDRELPMKDFVAMFVAGGTRGMLETLKNPSERGASGEVRLYLEAVSGKGK
jgi:molybdopterin-guanine dinucleotide biosynthesis protein B